MNDKALATTQQSDISTGFAPTEENIELLKKTVADDGISLTDNELKMFLYQCSRTGLDPLARQIYIMKSGGRVSFLTSIDGQRLVAQRTHEYEGQTTTEWCGDDGVWNDVWLKPNNPKAARVGVWRKGFKEPVYGVATWASYAKIKNGEPLGSWRKLPDVMLAKCAESLAFRKAFPQELANVYTAEEMDQSTPATTASPPAKLTANDALKRAVNALTNKGFTPEEKKQILEGIAETDDLSTLNSMQVKNILEITTITPAEKLRKEYLAIDASLLDDDKDPNSAPDGIDDEPDDDLPTKHVDHVVEPTDEEIESGKIELPDLDDEKPKRKKDMAK